MGFIETDDLRYNIDHENVNVNVIIDYCGYYE